MSNNALTLVTPDHSVANESVVDPAESLGITAPDAPGVVRAEEGLALSGEADTDFFEGTDALGPRQDPDLTPRQRETVEKLAEHFREIAQRGLSPVEQLESLIARRAQLEGGGNTLRNAELQSGIRRYVESSEGKTALSRLMHDGSPTEQDVLRQLVYIATAPEILSQAKQRLETHLSEAYRNLEDKNDLEAVRRALYGIRAETEGHGSTHQQQLKDGWERYNASPEGQKQLKEIAGISDDAKRASALIRYITQSPDSLPATTEAIKDELGSVLMAIAGKGLTNDQQAFILYGVRAVMQVGGDLEAARGLALRHVADPSEYVKLLPSTKKEQASTLLEQWGKYIQSSAGQGRLAAIATEAQGQVIEQAERGIRFIASIPPN